MSISERATKVLQEIDEQLALIENATPGPWDVHWHQLVQKDSGVICISSPHAPTAWEKNRHFIAASRTGWPAALRCLKVAIEGLLRVERWNLEVGWDARNDLKTICDQWGEMKP